MNHSRYRSKEARRSDEKTVRNKTKRSPKVYKGGKGKVHSDTGEAGILNPTEYVKAASERERSRNDDGDYLQGGDRTMPRSVPSGARLGGSRWEVGGEWEGGGRSSSQLKGGCQRREIASPAITT